MSNIIPINSPSELRRVVIESPYAGDIEQHITYARRALSDSVLHNEAPIASHLLFTQPDVLDDTKPSERTLGLHAGWAWIPNAHAVVVYTDYGISKGMQRGIDVAKAHGVLVLYRSIGLNPNQPIRVPTAPD